MNAAMDSLLLSLLTLSSESEWVEFKEDNANPEEIGEYLSALSNSAALLGREAAYLIWGIEDSTRRVVGTSFKPCQEKVKGQELQNWLLINSHPQVEFSIHEWTHQDKEVVLFEIKPCLHAPVRFKETEYIRIGSYKKKLKDHSEKERALWAQLDKTNFEEGLAVSGWTEDDVLAKLDYPKYFELLETPLPSNKSGILERLLVDRLIRKRHSLYDVTYLGAILFARKLSDFKDFSRKSVRIVRYKGCSRIETVREIVNDKGYASGFEELISTINTLLPNNEAIGQALRREVRMYPEKAIRELVPNAMIHQDFSIRGTGPMVEIFDDRLEVSNPGLPLIETLRFIDHSPRSRNEILADLMRRLRICEERGSGIDKIVFEIEFFQLPAPDFITDTTHTRVTLFAHQELVRMSKKDKIRACYQHCCLMMVSNRVMSNTTLRERFSIPEEDYPVASRIIRDTVAAQLIKPQDPASKSRKHARYVPFWA